jgi:glycosyltransferase involved in cell wall biosynthesis
MAMDSDSRFEQILHELPDCDVLMQLDNMLEGGMENVVIDTSCALIAWGYSVAILVMGEIGDGAYKAMQRGLRICVFPYSDEIFEQEIDRHPPKLVFAHYSFSGAHLYSSRNIPFVQVLHNVYAWFDEAAKQKFAQAVPHTKLFVAVSETVKEYSVERLGVEADKCLVIPNGIDLSAFSVEAEKKAAHLRKDLGFSNAEYIFLSVASVSRHKRNLAPIKAFHCIRDLVPGARLLVAGYPYDRIYLTEILAYIENNGLRDHVRYIGHTTSPEHYYLMADAFVHASCYEGGPLVLLEALAANCSIISTDVGFTKHFVSWPGVWLVDREFPYDPESFAHTETLRSSPSLVANLASGMLESYRNKTRPDLPGEVIDAFAATQSYIYYEQLVANLLDVQSRTPPIKSRIDLLPRPPSCHGQLLPEETTALLCTVASLLQEQDKKTAVKDIQIAEKDTEIIRQTKEITSLRQELEAVYNSCSWKVTKPLRAIRHLLRPTHVTRQQ